MTPPGATHKQETQLRVWVGVSRRRAWVVLVDKVVWVMWYVECRWLAYAVFLLLLFLFLLRTWQLQLQLRCHLPLRLYPCKPQARSHAPQLRLVQAIPYTLRETVGIADAALMLPLICLWHRCLNEVKWLWCPGVDLCYRVTKT